VSTYHSNEPSKNGQAKIEEKYAAFDEHEKSYLQLLTVTKESKLTFEAQKTLSLRVYDHWQGCPNLSVNHFATALQMDWHGVKHAIEQMDKLELWVDDPTQVQPTWFAAPQDDGHPRYHRYYLLKKGADIKERENRVLMHLWAFGKSLAVDTSRARLAKALHASPDWISRSLRHLQELKLVTVGESGRTVFLHTPESFDRWRDARPAQPDQTAEQPDIVLSENWVLLMVAEKYPRSIEGKYIVAGIEKAMPEMKRYFTLREIRDYWEHVLNIRAKAENVTMYVLHHCIYLKEALDMHARAGRVKSKAVTIEALTWVADQKLTPTPVRW
jgi:hypothetical protein